VYEYFLEIFFAALSVFISLVSYIEYSKWRTRPQVSSLIKNFVNPIRDMLNKTGEKEFWQEIYYKPSDFIEEKSLMKALAEKFLDKKWTKMEKEIQSLEELFDDLANKYTKIYRPLKDICNKLLKLSEKREITKKIISTVEQIIKETTGETKLEVFIKTSKFTEGKKSLKEGMKYNCIEFSKLMIKSLEVEIRGEEYKQAIQEIWKLFYSFHPEIKNLIHEILNIRSLITNSAKNIIKKLDNIVIKLIKKYKLVPEELGHEESLNMYKYTIMLNKLQDRYELMMASSDAIIHKHFKEHHI